MAENNDFTPFAKEGIAHVYAPKLIAFEHRPPTASSSQPAKNVLIDIGGLGDSILSSPLPPHLSTHLPPTWSLVEIQLTSSSSGWGTSSVTQDASEIAALVSYLRAHKREKIALLGHSTGCQDVMAYLTFPSESPRPQVQGGILQAGISDREAASSLFCPEDLKAANELAKQYVQEGKAEDVLPGRLTSGFFGATAVSARRWLSLTSPEGEGEDDMFSSDLPDEKLKQTFGSLKGKGRLCILYSGADEFVPESVDKEALVQRWIKMVKETGGDVDEKHSGIIEGASHDYKGVPKEVTDEFTKRVVGFLEGLE